MKTWRDIELAARENPVFHSAVTAVETGRATKEEALIVVSLNQAETIQNMMEAIRQFADRSPIKLSQNQ